MYQKNKIKILSNVVQQIHIKGCENKYSECNHVGYAIYIMNKINLITNIMLFKSEVKFPKLKLKTNKTKSTD